MLQRMRFKPACAAALAWILVGYLAGLMTKTGKVGFIGGMDIAMIRRFQMGYEAGAKAANPKAQIETNFVGVTGSAWANPSRGKELEM